MTDISLHKDIFKFKHFEVSQNSCAMKVGTDGVLLGAWATSAESEKILDVGTGTGLIALMLAQRQPNAYIDAVDIQAESAEEAAHNFSNSPWPNRLRVHKQSIQDFAKEPDRRGYFDLIVCNPPFFSGGTLAGNLSRAEVRHTVKLSHGELLLAVQKLLKPSSGRFAVILPYLEGMRFKQLGATYGLSALRTTEVFPNPKKKANRVLIEFSYLRRDVDCINDKLVLSKEEHQNWTEEYLELTKDFYLFA